jgi:uncharacterized protein with GYD domain
MPTYVALIDWTEQGVRAFGDSVGRFRQARERFESQGVRFRDAYWTLGDHDLVVIIDADDDESVAAALLAIASQGNIRTRTMRAFSEQEMEGVIGRAG